LRLAGGFQAAAKKHFNKVIQTRDDYGNRPSRGSIDDNASKKVTSSNTLDLWNNIHDCQLKCNFGLTTITCFRGLTEVLHLKWSQLHLCIQERGEIDGLKTLSFKNLVDKSHIISLENVYCRYDESGGGGRSR
jgi:hypothetical protein